MSSTATDSSATDAKRFIDANELHRMSEDLAFKVADDDFQPTFILVLWRGGACIGLVVQEVLQILYKIKIDTVAVRTESRDANGVPLPEIRVHAIGHAVSKLQKHDRMTAYSFSMTWSIRAVPKMHCSRHLRQNWVIACPHRCALVCHSTSPRAIDSDPSPTMSWNRRTPGLCFHMRLKNSVTRRSRTSVRACGRICRIMLK